MRVKDFAAVKVNFPEADFWLIRKGSAEKIGSPVRKRPTKASPRSFLFPGV